MTRELLVGGHRGGPGHSNRRICASGRNLFLHRSVGRSVRSGAAAVAAVLNGAIKASGRNIVPVVSGANIDFERLIEVLPST